LEFNFNTIIALAAVLVALSAFFMKMFDKSLSLREHVEYSRAIENELKQIRERQSLRLEIREFNDWRIQIYKDLDTLEQDLKFVEQTRPTAGELKMATEAVSQRLTRIEDIVKHLNGKQ
jgi:flagellar biosynthesis/type III secretory pathway chaperone